MIPLLAHAPHVLRIGYALGLGQLALPLLPLLAPLGVRFVQGGLRYQARRNTL